MEIRNKINIWVTTPIIQVDDFEEKTVYTNLRKISCNVQENFSSLEFKVYGEILSQMAKVYTSIVPPIKAKDNVYFEEPEPIGTKAIGTDSILIYNKGVAEAEKPKQSYMSLNKITNPTTTNIKYFAMEG